MNKIGTEIAGLLCADVLGDLLHTDGSASWGQHLITAAGGINVAEELGEMKDINVEQILKWNPEVIILSS